MSPVALMSPPAQMRMKALSAAPRPHQDPGQMAVQAVWAVQGLWNEVQVLTCFNFKQFKWLVWRGFERSLIFMFIIKRTCVCWSCSCVCGFSDFWEWLCYPSWCLLHGHRVLWTRAETAKDLQLKQRQWKKCESNFRRLTSRSWALMDLLWGIKPCLLGVDGKVGLSAENDQNLEENLEKTLVCSQRWRFTLL